MAQAETEILKKVMLAASNLGFRIFRNQVGSYKLSDGRYLSSGLCKGSSDLIGWKSVIIDDSMVGKKIAVFSAIEIKTKSGKLTEEQANFIKKVRDDGGISFCINDPENLEDFVNANIKDLRSL